MPVPFGDEEWISKAAQEPSQAKYIKANTAPVAKARRRPDTTLKPSQQLPKPEAARQKPTHEDQATAATRTEPEPSARAATKTRLGHLRGWKTTSVIRSSAHGA